MKERSLKLRAFIEFLVVAVCTLAFAVSAMGILAALIRPHSAGTRDYVEYWAAGNQLIHHENPYDVAAILRLELSAGFPSGQAAQMVPNPPSALLLVLPLSVFGATTGEWVWILLLIASLVASVQMIRAMYGFPASPLHILAYSFAPVLSCLLAGQISLFILLGLVMFLKFHNSRPLLAGASLWLCLLKPHLFLPFGLVLIVWIVRTRRYRIVVGTAVALAISSAVATILDTQVWSQYFQMMGTARVDRVALPSLSTVLRQQVYPHTLWLQCLPAGIGCIWALAYYWKRRDAWDWVKNGSLLMLVSVFVAPYTWFMDQAILIPGLLNGAYVTRSRTLVAILALMSAGIEIAALRGVELHSAFYLWTAPAWLAWYLLAKRSGHSIHDPLLAGRR